MLKRVNTQPVLSVQSACAYRGKQATLLCAGKQALKNMQPVLIAEKRSTCTKRGKHVTHSKLRKTRTPVLGARKHATLAKVEKTGDLCQVNSFLIIKFYDRLVNSLPRILTDQIAFVAPFPLYSVLAIIFFIVIG